MDQDYYEGVVRNATIPELEMLCNFTLKNLRLGGSISWLFDLAYAELIARATGKDG